MSPSDCAINADTGACMNINGTMQRPRISKRADMVQEMEIRQPTGAQEDVDTVRCASYLIYLGVVSGRLLFSQFVLYIVLSPLKCSGIHPQIV